MPKVQLPPMIDVESSNLQALGHSKDGLFVQFKGGATYRYAGCPAEVYHEGLQHESPGNWHRTAVIGKYPHEKL